MPYLKGGLPNYTTKLYNLDAIIGVGYRVNSKQATDFRFLDLVGFSNTELLNYKKIATDCHIDAKTVKEYYQILLDTLLGYYVTPFNKQVKRQLISSTPKFYLFDVGIGTYLADFQILTLKGMDAGKAFEHYIFMELNAYIGLKELDCKIQY